jgi:hypothetical protein
VDEPIRTIWPAESAELLGHEVGFSGDTIAVRLPYLAPKPFDAVTQESIRNALRRAMNEEKIVAIFEWHDPKREPKKLATAKPKP